MQTIPQELEIKIEDFPPLRIPMENLGEKPIVRGVNPYTGLIDGDDGGPKGFRFKGYHLLDDVDPDRLVPITSMGIGWTRGETFKIARHVTYKSGPLWDYDHREPLLRLPVAYAIQAVNQILALGDLEFVLSDGFRSGEDQAALFTEYFKTHGDPTQDLSIEEFLRCGEAANDTASFCEVTKDDLYLGQLNQLLNGPRRSEFGAAVQHIGKEKSWVADRYLTFAGNVGIFPLTLNIATGTAHGSAAAGDGTLYYRSSNQPVCMGAPIGYSGLAAIIDALEPHVRSADQFRKEVLENPDLLQYILDFGILRSVSTRDFIQMVKNRRWLFWAMQAIGATFFSGRLCDAFGEWWHFNFPNNWGGNQADIIPGGGNTCHAVLRGHPHPLANWGNPAAHRMAKEVYAKLAAGLPLT